MYSECMDPGSHPSNLRSSRVYWIVVALNVAIAASFYLMPPILGYGWNSSPGRTLLNVHHEDRRYPATNIVAEPWGTSVVLGPAESRLRQYLHSANLPLWNPYQGLGEPYAAQGDGSPYSLPAIARALLPPWAGNLVTFAVFAIGAVGMYLLLALLGLSKEIRLFGAIASFLSTALTFHIARYNIADQNALLPLQFAVTAWAIRKRTPCSYLTLACMTAVTMTAGFIQSAAVAITISSLFAVALVWTEFKSWRERRFVFLSVLASTLVGLALSAPFWLPIAELSEVGYHKNVPSVVIYRPPPYNLAAFFFPGLFAEPLTFVSTAGTGILVDWNNLFATSSAFVLLLCLTGLFACKWDRLDHRVLFLSAIAIAILLALRFMHWPPFSLLSHDMILAQQTTKHTQAIAAFLTLFSSMLVLGQCSNWLSVRLKWVAIGFCLIPLTALVLAVSNSGGFVETLASLQPIPTVMLAALIAGVLLILLSRKLFRETSPVVIIVGSIVCAELSLYLPLGTGDWRIACVRVLLGAAWVLTSYLVLRFRLISAVTVAGCIILCYSAIVLLPKRGLPNQVHSRTLPLFAEFLRTEVGPNYRSLGIFPDFSSEAMVQDLGVVGPFATSGFAAFIHSIDPEGKLGFYKSSVFLLAGPKGQTLELESYVRYRPIFDWIGVRYLVLERAFPENAAFAALQGDVSFRPIFSDRAVIIFESLTAKSRFDFYSTATILRSQVAIIRQLQSHPSVIARSIFLESSEADEFVQQLIAGDNALGGTVEIKLLEDGPNYVRLKVSNPGSGIFVLKDSYFPGWEAFVDGRKAPVLRVDGMVRGVEIASNGSHIVELRYRPLSFWYGVFVGLCAFMLLATVLWSSRNSHLAEGGLVVVVAICLLLLLAGPALVATDEGTELKLGKDERVTAIDLRDVALGWRETDASNGQELFTRGIRLARIPIAVKAGRDFPLHIGDLIYLPDTGVAEIDARGKFHPVSAAEGAIVPVCRLFEAPDKGQEDTALYQQGQWRLVSQPRSLDRAPCAVSKSFGQ